MEKAGIEIIPELKIKYPEYSVITPITKKEFTLRGLKVSEEEAFKSSLITKNKINEHINESLFSVLVKKPDDIKTFQDFLKRTTVRDRDALFFGLYHATYKDIHGYEITCKECDFSNSVKVNFVNSFSMTMWDKEKINKETKQKEEINPLEYKVEVPLQIAENITFVLGIVTLFEEQEIMKTLTFTDDQTRAIYYEELSIKHILINIEGQKTPDKISDRRNIHTIYLSLPAADKKLIDKKLKEEFEKYGSFVKTMINCQKCGAQSTVDIDLIKEFFRALYE